MTLRELAVAAHRAREQEQAENDAAYRANRAEQACELVERLLGARFEAEPDPATVTATLDGVEFRVNWSEDLAYCPECGEWKLYPPDQPYCNECMETTGTNHLRHLARTRPYPPQRDPFADMTLGDGDWQTLDAYQAFGEGEAPRNHVAPPQWPPKSKWMLAWEAYRRRPLTERVAEEEAAYQAFLKRKGNTHG